LCVTFVLGSGGRELSIPAGDLGRKTEGQELRTTWPYKHRLERIHDTGTLSIRRLHRQGLFVVAYGPKHHRVDFSLVSSKHRHGRNNPNPTVTGSMVFVVPIPGLAAQDLFFGAIAGAAKSVIMLPHPAGKVKYFGITRQISRLNLAGV